MILNSGVANHECDLRTNIYMEVTFPCHVSTLITFYASHTHM